MIKRRRDKARNSTQESDFDFSINLTRETNEVPLAMRAFLELKFNHDKRSEQRPDNICFIYLRYATYL